MKLKALKAAVLRAEAQHRKAHAALSAARVRGARVLDAAHRRLDAASAALATAEAREKRSNR